MFSHNTPFSIRNKRNALQPLTPFIPGGRLPGFFYLGRDRLRRG
jgi:hypothetical protein